MSTPNREVTPYRRLHRGNTRWGQQRDELDMVSPPQQGKKRRRIGSPDSNTIFKLTTVPEIHVYTDSGDLITGRSRSVIGHSGATFRSDGPHTHGFDDEGDRVHIPAEGHTVPKDNNGLKRAREKALHHRGARKAKRK